MPSSVNDLNTACRFLLYMVADTFLSQDYERCLQLCTTDFTYVIAGSNLFAGNIKRFSALALEQLISLSIERE